MESIGEKLSQQREHRSISIDQAARETHIAKRFLEALENEHFDTFPGESYLIGFLRNYSDYLELDSDELISLYKNTQIQEQPSPIDELLDTKPKPNFPLILSILIAVVVVAGGALLLTSLGSENENRSISTESNSGSARQQNEPAQRAIRETVNFNSEILEQEFSSMTAVEVSVRNEQYRIEIGEITTPLVLYNDQEAIELSPNEISLIDVDGDASPDIRVMLKSFLENGNPVIRFDRIIAGTNVQPPDISSEASTVEEGLVNPGRSSEPSRERPVQQLTNSVEAGQNLRIEVIFRGPVMFRHMNAGGEISQQMYGSGERFQTEISDSGYFWISNAGKLQFSVNGENIRLGSDGQPRAFQIRKTADGTELAPLY